MRIEGQSLSVVKAPWRYRASESIMLSVWFSGRRFLCSGSLLLILIPFWMAKLPYAIHSDINDVMDFEIWTWPPIQLNKAEYVVEIHMYASKYINFKVTITYLVNWTEHIPWASGPTGTPIIGIQNVATSTYDMYDKWSWERIHSRYWSSLAFGDVVGARRMSCPLLEHRELNEE